MKLRSLDLTKAGRHCAVNLNACPTGAGMPAQAARRLGQACGACRAGKSEFTARPGRRPGATPLFDDRAAGLLLPKYGAGPVCSKLAQGVATPLKRSPACPTPRTFNDCGRPRLETKHEAFDARFLPASSQGTRPDVGGCLAGAYRHCAHGMLPIPADFRHGRGAD